MKSFVIGLALLTSMTSFASSPFIEGDYGNGKDGCNLTVRTGDFYHTNVDRLIVEMDITAITPWGAILTQTIDSSIKQNDEQGYVQLDNAAGIGSFIVIRVKFDKIGAVNSFRAQKASPSGAGISEIVSCENIELY